MVCELLISSCTICVFVSGVQTNAYIVWSLVSAGERGLSKEVARLVALGEDSAFARDPYFLGLLSATLFEVCHNRPSVFNNAV